MMKTDRRFNIEIDDCSAGYKDRTILQNLSCTLESGNMIGIIGPNGSGKSTLLRVLSGFLPPKGGKVLLNGHSTQQIPSDQRARQIAFMPQSVFFQFDYTVRKIVLMGRYPHLEPFQVYTPEDYRRVEEVLSALRIEDMGDQRWSELSSGEQRRTGIARALVQDTPCLLLDECMANLDPAHEVEIARKLKKLSREKLVILVSHHINLASELCDRILLLSEGRLVLDGTPGEVITASVMQQYFHIDMPVRPNPFNDKPCVYYPSFDSG